MKFSWTNLATSLVAITLLGCGKIGGLPVFDPRGINNEENFTKSGESIEISGQKGVGKREGDVYTKTFTVDNKVSTSEDFINTYTLQTANVTTTYGVIGKEDQFYQASNYLYYEFRLSQVPIYGVIDAVYVNGGQVASSYFAYNAYNQTLYFPGQYVSYNSRVRAVYRVQGGVTPSYAFTSNVNAVGVSITDAATGVAISGSFSNNVVNVSGVIAGQRLLVKFYVRDQAVITGVLKNEAIPGSAKINLPQCANAAVTTIGRAISSPCVVLDRAAIPVTYDYIDPGLQLFSIPEVGNADLGEWEVYIDGKLSDVYRRIGSQFYIDQIIPFGCKVEIKHRRK